MRGWLVGLVVVGCAESADPRLRDVEPGWAWEGDRPLLVIEGSGFRPKTRADVSSGRATQDLGFRGALGSATFDRLDLLSAEEIRGTTPPGLSVGLHSLEVTTPDGERIALADAFEVVALDGGIPPGDAGPDGGTGWLAEPPDWDQLAECGNESCDGPVAGCTDAGECPPCPEGALVWQTFGCDWSTEGNHLRQSDPDAIGCDALLSGLDVDNVQIAANIAFSALGAAGPHQAGLLLRATDACVAENEFYACLLEVDDASVPSLLRLVAYDGDGFQNFAWEGAPGGVALTIPEAAEYTIRARAVGGEISCELCADEDCAGVEASVAGRDARFERGAVGLRTYRTASFYRRILVWTP